MLEREPRSFTVNGGRRIEDALVMGLGTDWIELQWPDKRPGLRDTEGPRPARKERFRPANVEVDATPPLGTNVPNEAQAPR